MEVNKKTEESRMVTFMVKTKLFEGFSKEACNKVVLATRPFWRTFEKGQLIVLEGEPAAWIGLIYKGVVAGIKFYLEGSNHIIHMHGAGEVFGIEGAVSSLKTWPTSFTATEDSTLLIFPYRGGLDSLTGTSKEKLLSNMLTLLAHDGIKRLYKTEILSERSLRGRVWAYLQIMEKRAGNKTFRIHMNQEQLAQYLCVNRSSLSYELNIMRQEGLIDFRRDTFTMKEQG